jgi:hypothetical protein
MFNFVYIKKRKRRRILKKLYSSLYDADFELSGERIGNQCNSCKIKDCKKGQIEKIINNINLIRSED